MKKILMLGLFILTISLLVGCESGPTLRLYNWGEYIDDELVYEFEDETGIKVKQIAFDSNEVALTQIKSGNQYDLVIPSEYAIEQLIEEDLIEMIDWTKITTFNRDTDLADGLNDILTELSEGAQGYDILDYAIPYFWGNVGILYDTTTVDAADLTGWDVLTNGDYEIAFYNSSRDSFMLALKATGANSINTPTDDEFDTAASWLGNALTSETYVITDEIFDAMLDPARYDLAVSYSGDANYLMSENENLDFFVPEEGTNIWVDAFITPKGANMDYAYQFMNFMLSYDSALRNTEFVGYSSPRKDVFEEVLAVGGSFADYATSYDVRQNDNDEVYRYNESLKLEMDTKWQEILADKGYDDNEGLGTGAIAAIIVIGVLVMSTVVTTIIKKRR
ncbi:ABC transporter substrate-binding protein [Mariniplasma anaerobium]|uniref:Spermidine/putrescine ABC transporter substrate-binding protein n=1 Tax=Mariniplasma anaerobium TaxID=2735436 RepID=A0A7U9TH27_9MOLU|nr:ABC transporter substrate-binding protein [Mariniplasma anaerobium]BCR36227.1 spermidine/putrescine ABC transporter substrate-binding protein [Mariniplasma anaerobium]